MSIDRAAVVTAAPTAWNAVRSSTRQGESRARRRVLVTGHSGRAIIILHRCAERCCSGRSVCNSAGVETGCEAAHPAESNPSMRKIENRTLTISSGWIAEVPNRLRRDYLPVLLGGS